MDISSSPGASTAKVDFIPEVRVRESKLRDEEGQVFRDCEGFIEPLC